MKKITSLLLAIVLILSVFAFGGCADDASTTIKVGASTAPHAEILKECVAYVESKGFKLEIIEFADYVQPNTGTADGSLDANYFQHTQYLIQENKSRNLDLVEVAKIHYEPYGIYKGGKGTTLSALKAGDKILVPDDPSNRYRALKLLEENKLIVITNDKGADTSIKNDIDTKGLEIIELESMTIAAQLPEVAFGIVNGNYALSWKLLDSRVAVENSDSPLIKSDYGNIIAVKKGNEKSDKTKVLLDALAQPSIKEFINNKYNGTVVPFEAK